MSEQEQPKQKTSWGCLSMIAVVIVGCIIYITVSAKHNRGEDSARIQQREAHPNEYKKKCTWCGGIGRVGYMGESKAQYDRTGKGLGNPCTVCTGTGLIDK